MRDLAHPQLGVVLAVDGKRVTVSVGDQARVQKLSVRTLELIDRWEGAPSLPPDRLSGAPWSLNSAAVSKALPQRRDLAAAWTLLIDCSEALDFNAWVALIAERSAPPQRSALWLWLNGDQQWFLVGHGLISARPPADLKRLRQHARKERHRLQRQRLWSEQLCSRQPLEVSELDRQQLDALALLQQWAQGDTTTALPQELAVSLRQARCGAEPAAIRQLLVDLGQWDPHALPALRQSHWAQGFSTDLEARAQQLIDTADQERPGDADRVDLTAQHCFSIDDEDTDDIDDVLGLELTAEGQQRLWIHVADPGRMIEAGDPLDLEARRRASSLYLTQGILPMFPWALSTGPLSLRAGHRCPAWSLWVELDVHGAVASYGLQRSWIKPAYRLSYSDADELIDLAPPEESALADLHTLLSQRRRWREAHGALSLDQPEGRVRDRRGESPIIAISEPGPGRLLVAEAMILAGAVVAAHGQAHGLALPYRGQLPSTLPPADVLGALPPGPVRHAALKQGLSRGFTTPSPAPHFSLGLEAYVQATSPIRRYGDLLVQRQLALLAEGQPTLGQQDLQQQLADLEEPLRQGIQISREDQRHWRQVWFAEHRSEQWRATFLRWLRESDQLGLVWVETLAMELPCQCPAGSEPADALLLKVHRVDPLQDQLQLRAHR